MKEIGKAEKKEAREESKEREERLKLNALPNTKTKSKIALPHTKTNRDVSLGRLMPYLGGIQLEVYVTVIVLAGDWTRFAPDLPPSITQIPQVSSTQY